MLRTRRTTDVIAELMAAVKHVALLAERLELDRKARS